MEEDDDEETSQAVGTRRISFEREHEMSTKEDEEEGEGEGEEEGEEEEVRRKKGNKKGKKLTKAKRRDTEMNADTSDTSSSNMRASTFDRSDPSNYEFKNAFLMSRIFCLVFVLICSDAAPYSNWIRQIRIDAERKTRDFDSGHVILSSGQYHQRKATLGTERRWSYIINYLLRPFVKSDVQMEYLYTGCDLRKREYFESIYAAGLRSGIVLACAVARERNGDDVHNVSASDVEAYMMKMVEDYPALGPVRQLLRASLVAQNQRSAPKKGIEGDFMGTIHMRHMALPMYAASNCTTYVDITIQQQLERQTSMPFYNALRQRLCVSHTTLGNPSPDDMKQEKFVGAGRVESGGSRGGKVETTQTKKRGRSNCNRRHERQSARLGMKTCLRVDDLKQEDEEEFHSDVQEGDEQYEGEIQCDLREHHQEKSGDQKLTEEMHPIFIRAQELALRLFHPDDNLRVDCFGIQIPYQEHVSCINVHDSLASAGVAFYQIGEKRVMEKVRRDIFQSRPFDIPDTYDEENDTVTGRRTIKKRAVDNHPYTPTLHNNRFCLPSSTPRGAFKSIAVLDKEEEQLTRMISKRTDPATTVIEIMNARVGNDHMWTIATIAQEFVEVRSEFQNGYEIWWKNKTKEKFGKKNVSKRKILELSNKSSSERNAEWWATLLREIHLKFGASTLLKEAGQFTGGAILKNVWELSLDGGNTFTNMLRHPFMHSRLGREEDDQTFDLGDPLVLEDANHEEPAAQNMTEEQLATSALNMANVMVETDY